MIHRALNQKTVRHLPYEAFLDLAKVLGCEDLEPRNDLVRPTFDGISPRQVGDMVRERGLRLVGRSEIYPFNDWPDERAHAIEMLIADAAESGAETFSLIPQVDGTGTEDGVSQRKLREALSRVLPMLNGRKVLAAIEPIGFSTSSLKDMAELIEAIEATAGHLNLAGARYVPACDRRERASVPSITAIVHIPGISDPQPVLDQTLDMRRILVDRGDRCGTLDQISALIEAGYHGPFSFECTSPSVQESTPIEDDLRISQDAWRHPQGVDQWRVQCRC